MNNQTVAHRRNFLGRAPSRTKTRTSVMSGRSGALTGPLMEIGIVSLNHRLGGKPLPLPDGRRSMDKPSGIGRGKGKGLPGPAIMVMAKVWLIWVLVAPSLLGGDRGGGAGRVRELVLESWARSPVVAVVAALFGGNLSGGGSAPLGARGNAELPGRGLLEFPRCGKVFDRCGRDDMVAICRW